uniref:Tetraspanin n=2 Tax=Latimeria chalumnae TaxID=7897 RepID=H3AZH9_LATCH
MEKILTCLKYLMFLFNFLIFVGGICLLAVGIWVVTNPDGFQNIVTANPLLYTGAYIILSVGGILAVLGFLGFWGAIRENKCLLILFFLLILVIFIVELVGAILALAFRKQIKKEYFVFELQKSYKGDNSTDALTKTWNTIMIAFNCCGALGPEDFGNGSRFYELYPGIVVPDACCKRDNPVFSGKILDQAQCLQKHTDYINSQGCFNTIAKVLKKFIHIVGGISLGVLLIEMFAMLLALCLYNKFD